MYMRVTRFTERDQIRSVVGSTITKRNLVMDLFCFHEDPAGKTLFTYWMLQCVLVSDPLPCSSVFLLYLFVPAVLLVVTVDLGLVPWAVSVLG